MPVSIAFYTFNSCEPGTAAGAAGVTAGAAVAGGVTSGTGAGVSDMFTG